MIIAVVRNCACTRRGEIKFRLRLQIARIKGLLVIRSDCVQDRARIRPMNFGIHLERDRDGIKGPRLRRLERGFDNFDINPIGRNRDRGWLNYDSRSWWNWSWCGWQRGGSGNGVRRGWCGLRTVCDGAARSTCRKRA